MTGMPNTAESDLLKLLFQNTNFANWGDATGIRGSSTAGSNFIALHTANPGQTGNQNTNEAAYTNYARVAVARSSGGFTITGSNPTTAENAAAITFATCGVTGETETYYSQGQATSGANEIYFYGALTSSLAVSNGITPSFAINAATVTLT